MAFRFSVSGARGVIGDGIDPVLVAQLSAAFCALVPEGAIVLGRDSRVSGPMLRHSVIAALTACGRNVIDIGIVPTPTVQLAVEWLNAAGGLIITASHNPAHWNALKFVGPGGTFLVAEEVERLKELNWEYQFPWQEYDKLGTVELDETMRGRHIESVVALVEQERIGKAGLRVVADCNHGAGGTVIPQLLERLSVEFKIIGEEPHGRFTHNPEPVPANLTALAKAVTKNKADLGLAYDADVDRLALVGSNGTPLGEERTLQLAAWALYQRGESGDLAANLSTSRALNDVAKRFGGKLHRTPVGEINVVTALREQDCLIGGEGNGGVIYPKLHLGRDALIGTALVLELLARTGKKPEELVAELPSYAMLKEKVNLPSEAALLHCYDGMKAAWSDATADERDGLHLSWDDRWIQVRPSGTEPIVRIFAEAPDEATVRQLVDKARSLLGE